MPFLFWRTIALLHLLHMIHFDKEINKYKQCSITLSWVGRSLNLQGASVTVQWRPGQQVGRRRLLHWREPGRLGVYAGCPAQF